MLYVFGRIYEYGLYIMHDLSLILGFMRKMWCYVCDLLLNKIGNEIGNEAYGKVFYIILNIEKAYFRNW